MIYSVRTTVGQEKTVADMITRRAKQDSKLPIYSVSIIDNLRGYVLVESESEVVVRTAIFDMSHVKGVISGSMEIKDVAHLFEAKPILSGVEVGALIEVVAGPFKGEKGKVKRIDNTKEEITIELTESAVPIPITVKSNSIKVIDKGKGD